MYGTYCTVDVVHTRMNDHLFNSDGASHHRDRPYQHDSTASRLLSEVKHVRVRLVLRWGTTLESLMLISFCFLPEKFCAQQLDTN